MPSTTLTFFLFSTADVDISLARAQSCCMVIGILISIAILPPGDGMRLLLSMGVLLLELSNAICAFDTFPIIVQTKSGEEPEQRGNPQYDATSHA
jgi:hypothetical protein